MLGNFALDLLFSIGNQRRTEPLNDYEQLEIDCLRLIL